MMTRCSGDTQRDAHEAHISHFIPSVELRGSRAQKLAQLNTLMAHLERLRQRLSGDAGASQVGFEGASPYAGRVSWPWFATGVVTSGLFLLLTLIARSCA